MKYIMSRLELIEALAKSGEPDVVLDDRIWRWVNERQLNHRTPGWQYDLLPAPPYTSSLDAAHSLIPTVGSGERMDFILEHTNGGLTICARVGHNDADRSAWGATDAIALSRGALEAHEGLP